MLPKSKRLTRDDFSKLKQRTTIRSNYFDVVVSPSNESRFACVISKKRIKLAVDRNKTKRKIYNILRNITPKNPNLVIFYPKSNINNVSSKLLSEEIKKVFDTI